MLNTMNNEGNTSLEYLSILFTSFTDGIFCRISFAFRFRLVNTFFLFFVFATFLLRKSCVCPPRMGYEARGTVVCILKLGVTCCVHSSVSKLKFCLFLKLKIGDILTSCNSIASFCNTQIYIYCFTQLPSWTGVYFFFNLRNTILKDIHLHLNEWK